MIISRQKLELLAKETNFIIDNLEKVLRLSMVLNFLNNDILFKDKLALKGGTAINLTVVDLPRLSVDIDLDFSLNTSRNEMMEIKEKFRKRLIDFMIQEGYVLEDAREYFALNSFVFKYKNSAGNLDNIKVEINYLDRCHILPLETKQILTKKILENFNILTLNSTELYASKINALLSRATPRDLYDVFVMIENNVVTDIDLLRKCLLFYNVIGGNYDLEDIDYKNIESIDYMKYKKRLKPVLTKNDKFDLEMAKKIVIAYLDNLLVFTKKEREFLFKIKNKIYSPELLFDDEDIIKNIINHPAILWRINN